jgi:hypothetical protein
MKIYLVGGMTDKVELVLIERGAARMVSYLERSILERRTLPRYQRLREIEKRLLSASLGSRV